MKTRFELFCFFGSDFGLVFNDTEFIEMLTYAHF